MIHIRASPIRVKVRVRVRVRVKVRVRVRFRVSPEMIRISVTPQIITQIL